ncbi:MAG: hypothetical protein HQL03_10295 [Nitrospirae bacterium]|nr:hypothetical protein [Nitrospirota bacterium]MBF0591008.1 hypothetical protein [Nitrospirota bacterium]
MYTSLDEAKVEVWERWNNLVLRKRVSDFLGDMPEAFRTEPRAVLDRNIITPNNELTRFLELAKQVQLKPLGWEYLDDKFCTASKDKLALAKMPFFDGRNKKEETILHYRNIVDFYECDGERISAVNTLWSEKLVDFHHRLLSSMKSYTIEVCDASSWYWSYGKTAAAYYTRFLSLFICNGILFENFVTNEEEARFTSNIVQPSLNKIEFYFGIKPLIVPLIPITAIRDRYWYCYPARFEELVKQRTNNGVYKTVKCLKSDFPRHRRRYKVFCEHR